MTTAVRGRPAPRPAAPDGPLLGLAGITKRFGGVAAIREVHFQVQAGEIVGLIGENGAGKSTLMKVASGVFPSGTYDGTLTIAGDTHHCHGVKDAEDAGIVLIAQELQVAPELSIAENMFVGNLPRRGPFCDPVSLHKRARKWLSFFGIDADPGRPAKVLGTSEQRLMVIAGALSKEARVLILDEPTAALTDQEAETLFGHLSRLGDEGVGIVFITHRLDEIDRIADRVVVMRNGEVVDEFTGRPSRRELVRAMLGTHLAEAEQRRAPEAASPAATAVLELRSLTVADPAKADKLRVRSVNLQVRRGEIVGLYGLVGAGRTELLSAVYGSWPGRVTGDVVVNGADYEHRSPGRSIRLGMAMLTEDRKTTGNFSGQDLLANLSAANLRAVSRFGIIDRLAETHRDRELIRRLNVQPPDSRRAIDGLSGGNQQKVLLGRALATEPALLLLDEPTLGVDIGSRFQMYSYIRELARDGLGILLVSSDIEEVHNECDRILVMYKGRVTGEFAPTCQRRDLLAAATGGAEQ
ncbi:sugar ABC transporter ATP-binding protein [Actinomadura madurae]|uniref:sugar ABC transporter ATP-binding protein n=1 Tax=Actinomadura madurae TaxID=1993 RepID=UPI000D81E4A6|nr:sugar ABC transporter ATP-binding protein [Actinomadura madurae]SPT51242.1 Xylose import ATP-binding protein XylG [Actinomadura madurae]